MAAKAKTAGADSNPLARHRLDRAPEVEAA
jgi:hypothetical protein